MMRRRRKADRRFRRAAYLVGTAAAAVALGAGIAVGTTLNGDDGGAPKPPPVAQSITGQQFRATNASTGASGTVGLVDKGWGTQVSLELRGIKGRCAATWRPCRGTVSAVSSRAGASPTRATACRASRSR